MQTGCLLMTNWVCRRKGWRDGGREGERKQENNKKGGSKAERMKVLQEKWEEMCTKEKRSIDK